MPGELGKAVLELTTEGADFTKGLASAHKEADSWGGKVGEIGKAAILGLAGVGIAAAGALSFAAKEAATEETGIARLAQSVKLAGGDWDSLKGSIEGVIHAQEMQTAFSDNEQRDALGTLVALTGNTEEAMRRLPVAMDLARGANIDLSTASRLLGKVTDENVGVLRRYGITVEKGADATDLLDKVTAKFGGQAVAFGKTSAGAYQILQNELSNLTEQIGAAVLPGFVALAQGALGVVEGLREFADQPEVIAFLQNIWLVVQTVISILKEMFGVLTGSAPAAGEILTKVLGEGPAKAIMGWLAILRDFWGNVFRGDIPAAIGTLEQRIPAFLTMVLGFVTTALPVLRDKLLAWAKEFIAWIGPAAQEALVELLKLLSTVLAWLGDHSDEIGRSLVEWGLKFGEFLLTVAIPAIIENLPKLLWTIGSWIATEGIPGVLRFAIGLGKGLVEGLWQGLQGLGAAVWNAVRAAFEGINFWVGPFHVTSSGISIQLPQLQLPSFAAGGVMPWTGLALVHQGETITPRGQSGPVGASDDSGHGHDIIMDGGLVARAVGRRTMRGAELAGAPLG